MKYLKKQLFSLLIYILGFILLISITSYFSIISYNISNYLIKILFLIGIFIFNFKIGRKSSKKGLIKGIKHSLGIIIVLLFLNLITGFNFSIKTLLYYMLIMLTSILASILGVNKK